MDKKSPHFSQDQIEYKWDNAPDSLLSTIAYGGLNGATITLMTPGATIRGQLIPYEIFIAMEKEELGATITAPGDEFERERRIQEELDSIFGSTTEENDESLKKIPPKFIHLINAQIDGNGYSPAYPHQIARLRIPIANVTAWTTTKYEQTNITQKD